MFFCPRIHLEKSYPELCGLLDEYDNDDTAKSNLTVSCDPLQSFLEDYTYEGIMFKI